MKKITAIIFILVMSMSSGYQAFASDLTKNKVKAEAGKIAQAMANNDFETVVSYTYPLIIEKMGGKEQAIARLKQGSMQMKEKGYKIGLATIGDPEKIEQAGSLMYALVPQTSPIKVPEGKLISESYLLAVSENNGEKWYFIDTAGLTDQTLPQIFPALVGKLQIPMKKQPVFIKD